MAYDNPGGLIAAAVILQVIVFLCLGTRIASRVKLRQKLLISDWLIIVAITLGLGLSIIMIYGCAVTALGVPLEATIEDPRAVTGRLNRAKHLELAFLIIGILTLGIIKISVSFFYYHIFGSSPIFKKVIIVWIVVLTLWTASFVIAGLAECGNHLLALFGTPQAYLDHCGSAIPTGWAMVGSDVATDLITLILPIPMIWSLQMPLHRKILVAGTFMIGLLSIGAGIAKAYIYISASLAIYQDDAILLLTAIGTWNLVECQVGIIAACAPPMRPALKDLVPRESLVNLLDSIRSHLVRSSRSSSSSSRRPYAKAGSDGNPSFAELKDHSVISRVEIDGRSNSNVVEITSPEGIYIRRDVDSASADRVV